MTIAPFERQRLFAGHCDAIAGQCKRRLGSALLVLQITIEQARVVRATLDSVDRDRRAAARCIEIDRDRRAAARCIEKSLRAQLKVPARFSGRATFSYAFWRAPSTTSPPSATLPACRLVRSSSRPRASTSTPGSPVLPPRRCSCSSTATSRAPPSSTR